MNAESPMLVILDGIITLVRFEHTKNAELPMLVTPFGIVTLVKFPKPNASFPMLVTLDGTTYGPFLPAGY